MHPGPFAKRHSSGIQAAPSATRAKTSGTRAEASGTLAAISGQSSRIICPIRRREEHKHIKIIAKPIFCHLVPEGTINSALKNWKIKMLNKIKVLTRGLGAVDFG